MRGKFFVVGMGTHPDLVTLRGLEAIRKADVWILKKESELAFWGHHRTTAPEVWICSPDARIGLGVDPASVVDPELRAFVEENARVRRGIIDRIREAVEQGKIVAVLEAGDPLVYGNLYFFELLPESVPSEIIPGITAFQSGSAALKRSPTYGWDTSAMILTIDDWQGRTDTNEKLMKTGASLVFYAINLDYPALFSQLKEHYPGETPVAVVAYAGDPDHERIQRSTVDRFLQEIDVRTLPLGMHLLFVGKFIGGGQARKDALLSTRMRHLRRQA